MILLPHGAKIGKATVIVDIVKKGNAEIRPGIHMTPKGITDHDTGNTGRGANADMHNRYIHNMAGYHPRDTTHVSWHITVDEHVIIQHIPFNEPAFHCGDGWGPNSGNRTTIGIEKCMNIDGNRAQIEENAIALTVFLLEAFNWTAKNVQPHQYWSGKYCPAVILKRDGSFNKYRSRIDAASKAKSTSLKGIGTAKINTEGLSLRKGPGVNHGLIRELSKGEVYHVYAKEGMWYNLGADQWASEGAAKNHLTFSAHPKPVAPKPGPKPVTPKGTLYKVQIGAFGEKSNAEKLAKELQGKGYPVHIVED